ncbi:MULTISPECIES: hypothetical protein [unclassified Streptomyces]|uniref:hypothetical protein n=1 Tax=unclassified Streptomyces TaxID=2593676 RepID=UPI002E0F1EB1|nr:MULTISPECIES: hypothetical protein [unclassified Streptomyces]WSR11523.1 hypothetical protein OG265_29335 [Streptomyces sp. NBC_01208]WSR53214.1 hypothetical protein OG279_07165 [Streptomyces sp. NBC_01201]
MPWPACFAGQEECGAGTARGAVESTHGASIAAGKVIKTTKGSSADMSVKYKETARGWLAVNIIEC